MRLKYFMQTEKMEIIFYKSSVKLTQSLYDTEHEITY